MFEKKKKKKKLVHVPTNRKCRLLNIYITQENKPYKYNYEMTEHN